MIVRHFMSREVYALSPDRRCADALADLQSRKFRRAPVMNGQTLVGIVSERRLLSVLPGTPGQMGTAEGKFGMDMPVKAIASSPVLVVGPNDHLELAARRMIDHRVGGLPVVENDKVIGMLTESDAFRALVQLLEAGGKVRLLLAMDHAKDVDVAAVCVRHQVKILTLLRGTLDEKTVLVDLGLEKQAPPSLLTELWKRGCRLVTVERS
jgi:acetoin utilization protein AcuB